MKKNSPQDFWRWVETASDNACWFYKGAKLSNGYGNFKMGGKTYKAHRFSWELANGPIPLGKFILHRCDNKWCVNPNHLYPGDHNQNMRDMVNRGRAASGDKNGLCSNPALAAKGIDNGNSRLNEWSVLGIVAGSIQGATASQLAAEREIAPSTARAILQGKTWRWLTGIGGERGS